MKNRDFVTALHNPFLLAHAGKWLNYIGALVPTLFGIIYLTRSSFMPYHADALEMEWSEVNREMQLLILALMRAVSGGYIATGVIIIVLQHQFSSSRLTWIPPLILVAGAINATTSVYATLIIRINTAGHPPTELISGAFLLFIAAYLLNRRLVILDTTHTEGI